MSIFSGMSIKTDTGSEGTLTTPQMIPDRFGLEFAYRNVSNGWVYAGIDPGYVNYRKFQFIVWRWRFLYGQRMPTRKETASLAAANTHEVSARFRLSMRYLRSRRCSPVRWRMWRGRIHHQRFPGGFYSEAMLINRLASILRAFDAALMKLWCTIQSSLYLCIWPQSCRQVAIENVMKPCYCFELDSAQQQHTIQLLTQRR